MHSIMRSIGAAIICFILSPAATAATVDISGPLNNDGYYFTAVDPVGPFTDVYNFTLTSGHDTSFLAWVANRAPVKSIPDIAMTLFDGPDGTGTALASGLAIDHFIAAGTPSSITVTGHAQGIAGGHYDFLATTIPPVPLPAAGWLMLSALGLVLLVGRKWRGDRAGRGLALQTGSSAAA